MTRAELEHAIRAACDVAGDQEIWVFGSQAILGEHPDAPARLRRSVEVDVAPKNFPERVDKIDGALGELSQFHSTHGYYVHGVPIESARLPGGWEERAIAVSGKGRTPSTGWCIEAHDLAASKLAAFRPKDRDFVRILIVEELISIVVLLERMRDLAIDDDLRSRLTRWIEATAAKPPE